MQWKKEFDTCFAGMKTTSALRKSLKNCFIISGMPVTARRR
ncbi:hypothetical protein [Agriterribacter humi]